MCAPRHLRHLRLCASLPSSQGYRPAIVVKKRTPKHVQKGLEAAFRKRQNIKLKASRDEVMAALRRVLNEPCVDEGSLRTLFAEVIAIDCH